ncbi:MAG: saccharopine dehydrogenase NADP-binding domain-containing protein [Candidatus Thermoplasmatota archaeon]|nr:saccharopine dehydrogenase NADP-binding domain-containing protein [Candidatus Thermoplasmatota archaeon]MBS3801518.1 saccharopine dehydrogenase NADP-binding domain-containing protein [Candidatus Thermoplasmatota archaeon]
MNHVLVLGAGMVSRPLVRYLLDLSGVTVTMASRTVEKAEAIIDNHSDGTAVTLDVQNDDKLESLVKNADVIVSLLPYTFHVKVAKLCIIHKKHLVTTSYVSNEMQALDEDAKQAGILLLNECGLDPGIDHMSAMKIIHDVQNKSGYIQHFKSTTGALPSHENNTNPFGYKFSWSPRGVLLASRNPAKWLENGETVSIPGEKLFENYRLQDVPDVGTFENYPNRDSVQYKDIYGLKKAETVYRGTFRMTGWCETLRSIAEIGWLDDKEMDTSNIKTYADITAHLLSTNKDNLYGKTALTLHLPNYAAVLKRLEWLGLFSDILLPEDKNNPLDYLNVLTLEKMALPEDEKDMIVMHHEFTAVYDDKKEYRTSTLVNYGEPHGDSAVARTVAFPAAIAVKMILNNTIQMTGVHIPIIPEIYDPILDELETMNVKFKETKKQL